jgi:Holliday junction resolvase RusA-like endonuclease
MNWEQSGDMLCILKQERAHWPDPIFMEIFITRARCLWKERNNLLFNDVKPDVDSWKIMLKNIFDMLVHRTEIELHNFISLFLETF